jgi:hypothetical protein
MPLFYAVAAATAAVAGRQQLDARPSCFVATAVHAADGASPALVIRHGPALAPV